MAGTQESLSAGRAAAYRVFGGAGFAGNPARVLQVGSLDSEEALLSLSASLPPMDSAFYLASAQEDPCRLRFFSQHGEILICGHALLACAHHLMGARRDSLDLVTPFYQHRGRRREGRLEVSLPCYAYTGAILPLLEDELMAAGLRPLEILRFPNGVLAARLAEEGDLRRFRPGALDWKALAPLSPGALILTAAAASGGYVLRYFAPWFGKPEDSATGSAHAYLAACWLEEGERCQARQLSPAGNADFQVAREAGEVWVSGQVLPGLQ